MEPDLAEPFAITHGICEPCSALWLAES
jgi:hypothetical protein